VSFIPAGKRKRRTKKKEKRKKKKGRVRDFWSDFFEI
jgi:hypothetical protein